MGPASKRARSTEDTPQLPEVRTTRSRTMVNPSDNEPQMETDQGNANQPISIVNAGPSSASGGLPATSAPSGGGRAPGGGSNDPAPAPAELYPDDDEMLHMLTDGIVENSERTNAILATAKQAADDAAYTGLNIAVMRTRLIQAAKRATNNDIDRASKIIAQAVAIGIIRGNNTVQMQKTMSADGKNLLANVKLVLTVVDKVSRDDPLPSITFSRIINCFPESAYRIADKIKPKLISNLTAMEYVFALRNTACGALIPMGRDPLYQMIKKAYTVYQAQVSLVLQRKPLAHVNKKVLNTQLQYINTAQSQSLVSERTKLALLRDPAYNVMVEENGQLVLNKVLVDMAKEFDNIMSVVPQEDYLMV